MKTTRSGEAALLGLVLLALAVPAEGRPLTCDLRAYRALPGLQAALEADAFVVSWQGDRGTPLRMRLGIEDGQPVLRELAVRGSRGSWSVLGRMEAAVEGAGTQRTVVADLEWTFPLEFVEVVWGDGRATGRQVVSATHLPPFGRHRFTIPFDAGGKSWVRFAAWDSAGSGAFVQPVRLPAASASATSGHVAP